MIKSNFINIIMRMHSAVKEVPMSKKVLILSGSPRKGGNSDILCDEFLRGAQDAGHKAEKIRVAEKKVAPCSGCYYCSTHGGACVHKDDMADEEKASADTTLTCFRGYADCVEGAVEKGVLVAGGVYEPGAVRNTSAMTQAYKMGRNV
ncbi:NADPH-dependent FMN reductase [Faecalibacterium prausnitzii]|uniref:NADPH-dependent FMN reductase n=2 Tax=Faecalibacterium prausnitzii TaxID=853 RepID=A0A2A7AU11_9FIRM|nr:NADPH-dependent FMN reductase [Faecalibacterium prausnitzii]